MINIAFGSVFFWGDTCRVSHYYGIARHIEVDKRIGRDEDIIANRDIAYDNGIGAYPDFVSYGGESFVFSSILLTYGYALGYVAVLPNFYFWVDDQCPPMPEIKPRTNLRLRVNLESVFYLIFSQ